MNMHISLLINVCEKAAHGGRTFTRINPLPQEVATTASAASLEDANAAVEAAAAAFPPGRRRVPAALARSCSRLPTSWNRKRPSLA